MPASDYELDDLCQLWVKKIAKGKQVKEKLWGATARECMQFYDGPHDFMYGLKNARNAVGMYLDQNVKIKTTFKVTTNKVAEVVQRFGPTLYFNNPHRKVGPRRPQLSPQTLGMFNNPMNPMVMQQIQQGLGMRSQADGAVAELQEWFLNFTPDELDLRIESRAAITEALIFGMGVTWQEVYQPAGSNQKLVGSFYDSAMRLIFDPDADTPRNAKWVARECIHPKWEVEREYGVPPGSLKGNLESGDMQSMVEGKQEYNRDRIDGKTNDLLVYYKIYSRMGAGGRLKGADLEEDNALDLIADDNCFLVVAKNIPFPLNLPPQLTGAPLETPGLLDAMQSQLRWPIPFWAADAWPMETLGFHVIPGSPYPMSHLKPALGELRFINWVLSFLADKVYVSSRDFIIIAEHAENELRTKIKEGDNFEVIGIKTTINRKIDEMVQWLQHPPMNQDIMQVVRLAMEMFDKRTGLMPLVYGESPAQFRSAEEAAVKKQATNVIVDDMAECTARWQTRMAHKEGFAARLMMGAADVAPIFGEEFNPQAVQQGPYGPVPQPVIGPVTQLWMNLVYRPADYTNPDSIIQTAREYEYTIEADSLRKPDTDRDLANMDQFMQSPFAQFALQRMAATGDPTQVNAIMVEWAKVRQLDPRGLLFPPPPMPVGVPPSGGPPQGGAPAPQHPVHPQAAHARPSGHMLPHGPQHAI